MKNTCVIIHDFYPKRNAPANRWYRIAAVYEGNLTFLTSTPENSDDKYTKHVVYRFGVDFGFKKRTFLTAFVEYVIFGIKVCKYLYSNKYDNYVFSTPQIFVTLPLFFGLIPRKAKKILEIRDLWPETIEAVNGSQSIFTRLLELYVRNIYEKTDLFVVVTKGIKSILHKNYMIPNEKIHFIPNGALMSSSPPSGFSNLEKPIFLYAGTIGRTQGLIETIHKFLGLQFDFEFIIAGDGDFRDEVIKLSNHDLRINYIGYKNQQELQEIYSICNFLVVSLLDSKLFQGALPSKIHDAAFYGKPILHNVKGELYSTVKHFKAGLYFEKTEDLHAIIKSLDNTKYNNLSLGVRNLGKAFSIEKGAQEYQKILNRNL